MRPRHLLPLAALALFAAACTDGSTAPESPAGAATTVWNLAERADVGRLIFFDKRLSANANQSCASCHDPAVGWTGPLSPVNAAGAVYEGSVPGLFGNRKPPSSAYATESPVLHLSAVLSQPRFVGGNFWDGRATGEELGTPAADQALGPFLNPVEQALAAPSDVVSRICDGPYGEQFRQVWGDEICQPANVTAAYDAVGLSVAAFEASSESNAYTSKFDAFEAGAAQLTQEERLGLRLFQGKGRCATCHALDGGPDGRALFTDFTYDNIGVPRNPQNPWYAMPPSLNPDGAGWVDRGLGGFLATRTVYAALADANVGKHKVPTLRNVELRPSASVVKAYGHNGYFKSLEGIVHFYNTRDVKPVCPGPYTEGEALAADCWPPPEVADNLNTTELGALRLTPMQERAIVAFLRTLDDGYW